MLTSSSLQCDQPIVFRIRFNNDVFVFIEQAAVVHLPGDWADLAGSGILEIEDLLRLTANRLGHGHASCSRRSIGQDFDPAPFVRIVFGFYNRREFFPAGIVLTWAVIPMSAIGYLELNAAQSVQRNLFRLRTGAKDENAGLMIRISRDMPHREHKAIAAVVVDCIDDPAPGARTGHGAVFDDPPGGSALGQFRRESVFKKLSVELN